MRKNRISGLLSGMALLIAGACSSDMPQQKPSQGLLDPSESGGVFMAVDFKMPTGLEGTRSETTPEGGSTGGEEVGSDEENFVSSALIVLASTESKAGTDQTAGIDEFGFIVAGEVQNNRISYLTEKDSKQYRATARLQKENLNSFYSLYWDNETQSYSIPDVYVFVFCNPTKELVSLFDADRTEFGSSEWIEATCRVTQGSQTDPDYNVGIWSANSFLMNNVKLAKRHLPEKLLDWEYFTSVDKAFHLSDKQDVPEVNVDNSSENNGGSVHVERSVARFDFKDGSKDSDQNSDNVANTYDVLYLMDENGNIDSKAPIVSVTLEKMCLVNMGNKFYYVPRVSDNGQPTGANFAYCGQERPWVRGSNGNYSGGNYVVGPYAGVFGGQSDLMEGFSTYLNYTFFNDNGSFVNVNDNVEHWNVVNIEDVLNGRDDKYNNGQPSGYKVWRYVTENVIPATRANQVNGISTGIVFKAKINGTETAATKSLYEEYWNKGYIKNLANCLNGEKFTYNGNPNTSLQGNPSLDPIIYYYSGRVYMGWRHIRQAAIQASIVENINGEFEINRSNSLYKAVFGDGPIPGGMKYIPMTESGDAGTGVDIVDPRWNDIAGLTDEQKKSNSDWQNYIKSPNYLWTVWTKDKEESGDDSDVANEDLKMMREAITGAGITIFQSSTDAKFGKGYYCYYYYWNRHNDNGINGTMGPMEFDVVRNNVYKLSVDKIARLGHPRIPGNDPNPPTPDTPDESDEIYLDVRVQIAPWVVRLNSIQF